MPLDEIINDYKCKFEKEKLLNETIENVYAKINNLFKFIFDEYNLNGKIQDDIENEIRNYAKICKNS
jgi:hypothetical protein